MSMFDDDFREANDLLAEVFSELVALVRGSITTAATTPAQVSQSEYAGESEEGIETTFMSTDFLIAIDDYDFGSGTVNPRPGDQIKRTIRSVVHTYMVAPLPNGRCATPDVTRDEWNVHTKHIHPVEP